ncbi:thioether cross-link-forming SCIFF peptide maturase [Clostridium sp. 19966]|uniref:thioether cross-link-forming SCIFF peptide maturase n=1 Tax=Clostridium sp. 19966 TaxID=2768166 RepID=UPI0028DF9A8E|nr:thioether cross-link-forming SCIFF peptide maturase [Clostridium sp. 19966]MDT8717472.1 thioether cross-link-forming SCIFF peptide maturase [Clostridium sp. 19966]
MALIHKFKALDDYYAVDVNSGCVHVVDKLVYDVLIDEDNRPDNKEIIDKLKGQYDEKDILEALEDIDELISEEMLYSSDKYEQVAVRDNSKSFIKALCLNIAHDCNLKCKYCFADEGEYKGHRMLMTPEIGKKAIDFVIKNSGPRKNIEVDLFGGEPLLCFETIKQIVEYAKEQEVINKKNIRFTMTTNATLLNEEIMEYLDKNMGNIVLSIDGRKEVNDKVRVRYDGSGSHDAILKNIKSMVERRDPSKQYYARGTFTRNNTDFYNDVIYLANEGFKEISIEPVVLQPNDPLSLREEDLPQIFDSYDKLLEEMTDRIGTDKDFKFYHFNIDLNGGPCVYKRISGCGAGHEYVAITPEGDIYPCHQFVGNEEFKIGTIFDGISKEDMIEDFKKAHIYNKPKCKNCWARFYCSGGCQANNFNFNGDIHVPYELGCEITKKRLECAIALRCSKQEKNI